MEEFVRKSNQRARSGGREIVEVVLGLGSVTGLSWWMPDSWRPSHLLFCTFFIVVFAIAVRYHTLVAYSASSLASIIYAFVLWLRPEMRVQPTFLYLALEPFLLLLTGICTNDILRWQRQRLQRLEQQYAQILAALQKTQQRYQTALEVNEALEQQVSGLPTSLATISEKMLCLWRLDREERYAAILDLVISAVETQSCALYLSMNGSWHLYAGRPIDGSPYAPVLDTSDPLITRAIEHREVSTIRDSLLQYPQLDQKKRENLVLPLAPAHVVHSTGRSPNRSSDFASGEESGVTPAGAVMVGPLLNQGGEVAGLVVIDHMPLLKFTPGAVRLFRSLLHMASISLQTARPEKQETGRDFDWMRDDPESTEPALSALSGSGNMFS